MLKVYNKLVRDRIPEMIEASGSKCVTAVLSQEAYLQMLDKKLDEELEEYQQSKAVEELADLLEVIEAVAQARGCSWEQLTEIREKKRKERGGFHERIFLQTVQDTQ